MARTNVKGTVYLIHFSKPFQPGKRKCLHYIGWTEGDVNDRLSTHRSGQGSKLLKAVNLSGITYEIVATWKGTRHLERFIKSHANSSRFCPCCNENRKGRKLSDPVLLFNQKHKANFQKIEADTYDTPF